MRSVVIREGASLGFNVVADWRTILASQDQLNLPCRKRASLPASGLAAAMFEHVLDGLRHFAAAAVFGMGPVPGDALVEGGALRHRVGFMPLLCSPAPPLRPPA